MFSVFCWASSSRRANQIRDWSTEVFSIISGLFLALIRLTKAVLRAWKDPEFHVLAFLMVILLISGTTFYVFEEDWSVVDALYFCVMTMSTVGYGDLTPTSDLSKIFTIVFSLIGIGIFVGVASKLAQAMLVRGRHAEK